MLMPNEICATAAGAGASSRGESASVLSSCVMASSYAVASEASVPFSTLAPQRVAALDDAKQHRDDRDHKQDMNQAAERIGRGETEQPEDDEDDDDGVEHGGLL